MQRRNEFSLGKPNGEVFATKCVYEELTWAKRTEEEIQQRV